MAIKKFDSLGAAVAAGFTISLGNGEYAEGGERVSRDRYSALFNAVSGDRYQDETIERVARAICAVTNIAMEGVTEVVLDNPDFVIPAHKRTDGKALARWQLYVPQAKAAIEALRGPPRINTGPHGHDFAG